MKLVDGDHLRKEIYSWKFPDKPQLREEAGWNSALRKAISLIESSWGCQCGNCDFITSDVDVETGTAETVCGNPGSIAYDCVVTPTSGCDSFEIRKVRLDP